MSQVALAQNPDVILAQAHPRALTEGDEATGDEAILVLGREPFRVELFRIREEFRVHVEPVDGDVDGGPLGHDEVGAGHRIVLGAGACDEWEWG